MNNSASGRQRDSMVFLSYSRKDSGIVSKFRLLYRVLPVDLWKDDQSLAPGDNWREEITKNIEQCERMLVFWCRHSSSSSEVQREYKQAISKGKRVVPILLDNTDLPYDLQHYQVGYRIKDILPFMWISHEIRKWEYLVWIIGIPLLAIGGANAYL